MTTEMPNPKITNSSDAGEVVTLAALKHENAYLTHTLKSEREEEDASYRSYAADFANLKRERDTAVDTAEADAKRFRTQRNLLAAQLLNNWRELDNEDAEEQALALTQAGIRVTVVRTITDEETGEQIILD